MINPCSDVSFLGPCCYKALACCHCFHWQTVHWVWLGYAQVPLWKTAQIRGTDQGRKRVLPKTSGFTSERAMCLSLIAHRSFCRKNSPTITGSSSNTGAQSEGVFPFGIQLHVDLSEPRLGVLSEHPQESTYSTTTLRCQENRLSLNRLQLPLGDSRFLNARGHHGLI